MDFLWLCGGCSFPHAPNRTRFAEAISLLGLSLGSRTFRDGRTGVNNKYLDTATGPFIHRPAFVPGRTALLQSVGTAREIRHWRTHAIVFGCGTRDLNRVSGFISDHHLRMKDFWQCLNSSNQSRPGTRGIGVSLKSINAAIADCGNCIPLGAQGHGAIFLPGLFCVIAARRHNNDVGCSSDYIFKLDAKRRRAHLPKNIFSASQRNHLWNPVAAYIEGVQPLKKSHARPPRNFSNLEFERVQALFAPG